jgi:hypothetical protein
MISKWWIERCFKKRLLDKMKRGEFKGVYTERLGAYDGTNIIINHDGVKYTINMVSKYYSSSGIKITVDFPNSDSTEIKCSEQYFNNFYNRIPKHVEARSVEDTAYERVLIALGKLP